jgi:hypothetical protein
MLGSSHPLVETIETLAEARRQSIAVGVILLASLVPATVGIRWAQTAAVGAGAMLCALAAAEVCSRRRLRRQALALIIEGRETIPVEAVEEQRERLLDGRHRTMLATSLTASPSRLRHVVAGLGRLPSIARRSRP